MRVTPVFALLALISCLKTELKAEEIPFQFREGLLWVQVNVANESFPFLLDTGAETSVIDLATAKTLGLSLNGSVAVKGVHSSMAGYWCDAQHVSVGGVVLPKRLLALDLQKLSRSCKRRVDGLIGADFFKGRIVQIDFENESIRFLPAVLYTPNQTVLPLQLRRCGMRVKASVNGQEPSWFRVDTGCASGLQWVTSRVDSKDCSRALVVGLQEMTIPRTTTSLTLGTQTLTNVETGLHETPIFAGESGLVGNGIFSRFATLTIDALKGSLLLAPKHN
jgi:hypothetical protein